MSASTPITQRDVAQACGVHPSTICLALKNSPSIPLETRRRIQATADELGYHPNVAARNLALLRTEKKPGGSLPIAWINQEARRDHWRTDPVARRSFDAAREQATQLGFHLEEIWTHEPGMSVGRIIQIIRARGIEGVVMPVHEQFDFALLTPAWAEFALVGLNDLRLSEWTDVFAPDYHQEVELALRCLRGQGLRRIGLFLSPQFDAASNGLAHGCFLRHQALASGAERVPVCLAGTEDEAGRQLEFVEWYRAHQPEAVLIADPTTEAWARSIGLACHWVQLQAGAGTADAGIESNAGEIAAAAIEAVVAKMRRFEKGLSAHGRSHFIRGTWRAGSEAVLAPATVVA